MADRSDFTLDISGVQPAPTPYAQDVQARRNIVKALLAGNGTDQVREILVAEQVVLAGGTYAVDLKTQLDRYGNACNLDDIVLIYAENADVVGGGGTLEIRPNGVNGFTNWLGAGSAIKLPLAAFNLVGCFVADKYAVTAGNRAFDVVETTGATPAYLKIHIWGRQ